jgi:hypothetical protein
MAWALKFWFGKVMILSLLLRVVLAPSVRTIP